MRDLLLPYIREMRFPGVQIYIPLIAFLIGLGIWAVINENDTSFYWRDPAAITGTGPWIGLFSNIGIFLWWISGVLAVFTGILLRWAPGQTMMSAFLLGWGALTGMLALDDFFMIHEWVVPTYLPLSEDFLFGVYFVIALFLLVFFRNELFATPYPVFAFAFACFGASLVVDFIGPFRPVEWGLPIRLVWNLEYIVEDGFKLIGIIAWLHYFSLVSIGVLRPYMTGEGGTDTQRLPAARRKRSKVR